MQLCTVRARPGSLVEKLLRDLGLTEQLGSKMTQLATGGDVMQRLGKSSGHEIGFTMVSEIRLGESYGGSLVGPLPAAVQTYTAYDAVVMSASASPAAARAFVRAISTPGRQEGVRRRRLGVGATFRTRFSYSFTG